MIYSDRVLESKYFDNCTYMKKTGRSIFDRRVEGRPKRCEGSMGSVANPSDQGEGGSADSK